MLVSLTVENWRSIKTAVTLSMVASKERAHSGQLTQTAPMYGTAKVLPLAAIYGPNASGKSNLIDAMDFLAFLVSGGVPMGRPIPVEPYRLNPASSSSPTNFGISILLGERIYRYDVSLTRRGVLSESLRLLRTRKEEPLYTRGGDDFSFPNMPETEPERLRFIAEGTRQNQLFLNSAVSQNVHELQPIYDWFARRLNVVGIGATYSGYTSMLLRDDFTDFINRTLERYGTGVHGVRLQTVSREAVDIPSDVLEDAIAELPTEGTHSLQLRKTGPSARDLYVIESKDGEI